MVGFINSIVKINTDIIMRLATVGIANTCTIENYETLSDFMYNCIIYALLTPVILALFLSDRKDFTTLQL